MKILNKPKQHKYNCLFLPGMPGQVKEFNFFKDVHDTGGKVYWLQYAGTYERQDGTNFTIESSLDDIEDSLGELSKNKKPILVVAYSYSTALLDKIDFIKFPSVFGLVLFSPIRGLGLDSIGEDFNGTISELISSDTITADKNKWSKDIKTSRADYGEFLGKICRYDFPVMVAYSLGDTTIKANEVRRDISDFRQDFSYNSILVFEQAEGYHKLDSYYNSKIGNFFRALEIELDLMSILDKKIFVYLWGSSLNYNYSSFGSDIDLLIFYDDYVSKYRELNNYVENYNKIHKTAFDLSINNKTDLLSKRIFRYNRGPVAIHELVYAYFPLRRATEIVSLTWNDVMRDAYNASLILSGESKKILSKCDIKNDRVKKIIKYLITSFSYLQYLKGIKNIDLNNLEYYLDTSDVFYKSVKRALDLKKTDYTGMDLNDLHSAVVGMDEILRHQEQILGINKR